ncbi:hypothetical protein [Nocardioides daejeonensis]|uniref:hypothetical protein n=1 Tax=Nocardioides daejeonensis TaxID=1046556 RepID=UPI000D740800|nr:hypothetical protein [Nocardioides daejeonensis]
MRSLVLTTALACVALTAACGGDSDDGDGDATSPLDASVAAISDCLEKAGLPAVDKEAIPFGVDDPVRGVKVDLIEQQDAQGMDIWVFESQEAAAENRVAITLSKQDTPTSGVVAAVVYRWYTLPDPDAPYVAPALDCLSAD